MIKAQKGFTLVELIVVITILAILGTIAFISLQGYSQDAKNSKVTSDLRTLASSIETRLTDGMDLTTIVDTDKKATNTVDNNVSTFGNVSLDTPVVIDDTATTGNYEVGTINFISLKQNGTDFIDPEKNGYLVAYVASGSVAYYQVAGQTKGAVGYKAVIKGNYLDEGGADADGLFSASGATTELTNGADLTATVNLY